MYILQQFIALVLKNVRLTTRRIKGMLFVLVSPLAALLIVLILHLTVDPNATDQMTSTFEPTYQRPYLVDAEGKKGGNVMPFGFLPSTPQTIRVMQHLADALDLDFGDDFTGFNTYEELGAHVNTKVHADVVDTVIVFAPRNTTFLEVVKEGEAPAELLTVDQQIDWTDKEIWKTMGIFLICNETLMRAHEMARDVWDLDYFKHSQYELAYNDNHFLVMKHISAAIMGEGLGGTTPNISISIQQLEDASQLDKTTSDEHTIQKRQWVTATFGGLIWQLCGLGFLMVAVSNLMEEKSMSLKAKLSVLGLSEIVYLMSWFVVEFVKALLAAMLITFLSHATPMYVFRRGALFILVLGFLLYFLALFAVACFICSVCPSTTASYLLASLFVAFGLIFGIVESVFASVHYNDQGWYRSTFAWALSSWPVYANWMFYLLPPFHFGGVLSSMQMVTAATWFDRSEYDMAKVEALWRDPNKSYSQFPFWPTDTTFTTGMVSQELYGFVTVGDFLLWLFLDTLIYMFLAWYFGTIFAGKTGNSQPFYFMFTKTYWFGSSHTHQYGVGDTLGQKLAQSKTDQSIVLHKVSKVFKNKSALKELSVEIHHGQTFCLLGPNGAGKTTSMNILTGVHQPTHGNAFAFGMDVSDDIQELRKYYGICEQEDLLWPELTGRDHLLFYSRFRGLNTASLDDAVDKELSAMKLSYAQKQQARTYSGGMKRRLCVAIASIVQPKVLFLDEPTTGMDPVSKKYVWDKVLEYKKDHIVVLTTHSMEEADALGDTIAIICEGRLRAYGTSLFLKNRYGNGYKFTCICTADKCDTLKKNVKDIAPAVEEHAHHGDEVVFRIPREQRGAIPHVFRAMKGMGDDVRDWGVSNTTLEEVFLKVAVDNRDVNAGGVEEVIVGDYKICTICATRPTDNVILFTSYGREVLVSGVLCQHCATQAPEEQVETAVNAAVQAQAIPSDNGQLTTDEDSQLLSVGSNNEPPGVTTAAAKGSLTPLSPTSGTPTATPVAAGVVEEQVVVDDKPPAPTVALQPEEAMRVSMVGPVLALVKYKSIPRMFKQKKTLCCIGCLTVLLVLALTVFGLIMGLVIGDPEGYELDCRFQIKRPTDPDDNSNDGRQDYFYSPGIGLGECPDGTVFVPYFIDWPAFHSEQYEPPFNHTMTIEELNRDKLDWEYNQHQRQIELQDAAQFNATRDCRVVSPKPACSDPWWVTTYFRLVVSYHNAERFPVFGSFRSSPYVQPPVVDSFLIDNNGLDQVFQERLQEILEITTEDNEQLYAQLQQLQEEIRLHFTNIPSFGGSSQIPDANRPIFAAPIWYQPSNKDTDELLSYFTQIPAYSPDFSSVTSTPQFEHVPCSGNNQIPCYRDDITTLQRERRNPGELYPNSTEAYKAMVDTLPFEGLEFITLDKTSRKMEANLLLYASRLVNVWKEEEENEKPWRYLKFLFPNSQAEQLALQKQQDVYQLQDQFSNVVLEWTGEPPFPTEYSLPRFPICNPASNPRVWEGKTLTLTPEGLCILGPLNLTAWPHPLTESALNMLVDYGYTSESEVQSWKELNLETIAANKRRYDNRRQNIEELWESQASKNSATCTGCYDYYSQNEYFLVGNPNPQRATRWDTPRNDPAVMDQTIMLLNTYYKWLLDDQTAGIRFHLISMPAEQKHLSIFEEGKTGLQAGTSLAILPLGAQLLLPFFVGELADDMASGSIGLLHTMGMDYWQYWVAIILFNLTGQLVYMGLFSVLCAAFTIVSGIGFIHMWILFFLYGWALIGLSALVAGILNRGRLIMVVACILCIVMGIAVPALVNTAVMFSTNQSFPVPAMLVAPVALVVGLRNIFTARGGAPGGDYWLTVVFLFIDGIWMLILGTSIFYLNKHGVSGVLKPFQNRAHRKRVVDAESERLQSVSRAEGEDSDVEDMRSAILDAEQSAHAEPKALFVSRIHKSFAQRGANRAVNKDGSLNTEGGDPTRATDNMFLAVRDVSMFAEKGECFGLLGPNGAGKSTIMHMVTGEYQADKGYIALGGHDIHQDRKLVAPLLGVCAQDNILWTDLTVKQHLTLYAAIKGTPRSSLKGHVQHVAETVRLDGDEFNQTSGQLSGGMKRRLCIGIALTGRPSVLLLDEPTTGLDPESRRVVWDVVTTCRKDKCVLLTTHSMEEADALCSSIAIMAEGRLRCVGNQLHLKNKYGDGYKLNITFKTDTPWEPHAMADTVTQALRSLSTFANTERGGEGSSTDCKHTNNRTHHNSIKIMQHIGTNIVYNIQGATVDMSQLFALMDTLDMKSKVADWGISMCSLDDVFISVVAPQPQPSNPVGAMEGVVPVPIPTEAQHQPSPHNE